MINGEFFVKKVSEVLNPTGDLQVRTVTLSRKVCKFGDNGAYAAEEVYACELTGTRALNFSLIEGDRLVAIITPDMYTANDVDRPINRLGRYCLV